MKKIISLAFATTLLTFTTFSFFESEIANAASANDSVGISFTVSSAISISEPGDIDLGTLNGLLGGTATGSATWNVKTSNDTGYNIGVKASTDPALKTASFSFANYTPTGTTTTPDYDWEIGVAISEFGFAPYNATSQVSKFKNNGSSCNITGGSVTAWKCWFPFATSDTQIANRATMTSISGEDNVVYVEAEIDAANGNQEDGSYTATITATATEN